MCDPEGQFGSEAISFTIEAILILNCAVDSQSHENIVKYEQRSEICTHDSCRASDM